MHTSSRFGATVFLLAMGGAVLAQTPAGIPDRPPQEWESIAEALRGHEWADAINNLLESADAMPDAQYSFRPLPALMTFGEVIGHVADVQFYFFDVISGSDPATRPVCSTTSKTDVRRDLLASIKAIDAVFDTLTDAQLAADHAKLTDNLTTMIGHTRRETGKLVTYLRLAGASPPALQFYRGRIWRTDPLYVSAQTTPGTSCSAPTTARSRQ